MMIKISIHRGRKKAVPSELVRDAAVLLPMMRSAMRAKRLAAAASKTRKRPDTSGRAVDFVAHFLGKGRRTLAKAAAVVEAATKEPARYGELLAEMDSTGRIDPAYRRLLARRRS
jgi:hypothetical protein